MLEEFTNLRQSIRKSLIKDKDYYKCIEKCNSYWTILKKITTDEAREDKWFCNYETALSYKKLADINNSIKYGIKSLNYTNYNNINIEVDKNYINSVWILAECYALNNSVKECKKMYFKCARLYKVLEDDRLRICTIFNLAKIYKSTRSMEKLIKLYENDNLTCTVRTYGDMEKSTVLKEMYSDLASTYIQLDQRNKALDLIKTVEDNDLKMNILSKLVVA